MMSHDLDSFAALVDARWSWLERVNVIALFSICPMLQRASRASLTANATSTAMRTMRTAPSESQKRLSNLPFKITLKTMPAT